MAQSILKSIVGRLLGLNAANDLVYRGTKIYYGDADTGLSEGVVDLSLIGSTTSTGVFYPVAATTAAIIVAALAAAAAGGGIVQLPPGTITVTQSLPLLTGVVYRGVGYRVTPTNLPVLNGGTIVQGDGTFPIFGANVTDLGSPYLNGTLLLAQMVPGCGVQKMGISNGSYGIKCGALYQAGPYHSLFSEVFIQNCTAWGLWAENMEQTTFERISTYANANGQAYVGSGTGLYNMGNSHFRKLISSSSTANGHGREMWFTARGASQLNNLCIFDLGLSGQAATSTQAATCANTSTAVGVTDLSKFGVGMPVYFSATVNGLTASQVYFVLTKAAATGAGNITVCPFMGGTSGSVAVTCTGNSAVNIITNGWPNLEVGGADAGSFITYSSIKGAIDCEVGGTANMVFQGLVGFEADFGIIHSTAGITDVCVRNCTPQGIRMNFQRIGSTLDIDNASNKLQVTGPAQTASVGTNTGIGMKGNGSTGLGELSFTGSSTADMVANGNFFNQIQMQNAFALKHSQNAAGVTLATASGNLITYTGAVGTLTLPNLSTVNLVGWMYFINNPGASTLTVSTSASQNIVGAGASGTSISVATLTSCILISQNNAGTMYWARYA